MIGDVIDGEEGEGVEGWIDEGLGGVFFAPVEMTCFVCVERVEG